MTTIGICRECFGEVDLIKHKVAEGVWECPNCDYPNNMSDFHNIEKRGDTKLKSMSEALLNIGVGFWINFALNAMIFPHFGIPFNLWVYMQIGGFYTITSLVIQYPIRRLFNHIAEKQSIKGTFAETALNTGGSWVLCWITGLIVLPHYGMQSTLDVTIVNTIGTITTAIRRFLFRRVFNHYGPKENLYTLAQRFVKWCKHEEIQPISEVKSL